ncbi:hypothetical protein SAMN04489864_104365 [Pedobacter insulae]|uniref:Uncharacterized protein n=1 Tax=Pedobacter insulae TaxID=414048 RepID=A0A1I2WXM1_9SPHI|nr:hypothetical protein SAMN04489864_104365 [Pedobacter insulae]
MNKQPRKRAFKLPIFTTISRYVKKNQLPFMGKSIACVLLLFFGKANTVLGGNLLYAQEVYEKTFLGEINRLLGQINTIDSIRCTEHGIESKNVLLPWYEFKRPFITIDKQVIQLEGWNKEIHIPFAKKRLKPAKQLVERLQKYSFKPLAEFRKDNFYFTLGKSDTVYLAVASYYSIRPISIEDYKDFCEVNDKLLPYFPKVAELSFTMNNLSSAALEEYCGYLSKSWDVPISFFEIGTHGFYRIVIVEKDWNRKEFLDKINGYMKNAYRERPPIRFAYDQILSDRYKSLSWVDVDNMIVDRNKKEVTIKTHSGRELMFTYKEDQYSDIASLHVNFLAFFKEMLN